VEIAKASTEKMAENPKRYFWRLLGYILPYKKRLIFGILAGVAAGVSNGILLLVLKSVFTIVLPVGAGEVRPEVYYPFADIPVLTNFEIRRPDIAEWIFVLIVCLSIPTLLLIRALFQFIHQYMMLWINLNVVHELRRQCFGNVMRQSLSFFNVIKQGDLIQTVSSQTNSAAAASSQLLSALIQNPISIISIFAMVLIMDPLYTLGAVVIFPLCLAPVILIARKVRKAGGKEEEAAGGQLVTMHESFSGVRLIKAQGREQYQTDRFVEGSLRLNRFVMRSRKAVELATPAVEVVGSIGISIGMLYAWKSQINPETFLTLNLGLMSIYPHVKALSRVQLQMHKCAVAARKVFGFIDATPEVDDKPDAVVLERCRGDIALHDVVFSYVPERRALDGVSLHFEAGKRYALVGHSGSGKSSLLSLILRFYDVDSGRIEVDGLDIRDYTQQSLRDQIGLVSQDTFLFHDTIEANIRFGLLGADREQIERAARLAHAHEFILAQPQGYETVLGDKGCTLSGGQQQRLSIARAILRDAPILFLDEATSALDSESERAIQSALAELSKGKTVVSIAHRLSTVLDSDEIVVLGEGKVIDVAPHATLLERCPEYQRLYQLQYSQS
jgi:subfamily B ATP-binding cassette protein MsbA